MADNETSHRWITRLPETLVVACSDGRIQGAVDEFLRSRLDICDYDRLYVPGGAGALAKSGAELLRARRIREECQFLIDAHRVGRAVLFFHGPSADGPAEAVCGDYRRRLPGATLTDVRLQQHRDARRIMRDGLGPEVGLELYMCEVESDGFVRIEPMML